MKTQKLFSIIRAANNIIVMATMFGLVGLFIEIFSSKNPPFTIPLGIVAVSFGYGFIVFTNEWWESRRNRYGEYCPAIMRPEYNLLSDPEWLEIYAQNWIKKQPVVWRIVIYIVSTIAFYYLLVLFSWNLKVTTVLFILSIIMTVVNCSMVAVTLCNTYGSIAKNIKYLR